MAVSGAVRQRRERGGSAASRGRGGWPGAVAVLLALLLLVMGGAGGMARAAGPAQVFLIIAIDQSLSMAKNDPDGWRMDTAKFLVSALSTGDEVALFTFATHTQRIDRPDAALDPTRINGPEDQQDLWDKIGRIPPLKDKWAECQAHRTQARDLGVKLREAGQSKFGDARQGNSFSVLPLPLMGPEADVDLDFLAAVSGRERKQLEERLQGVPSKLADLVEREVIRLIRDRWSEPGASSGERRGSFQFTIAPGVRGLSFVAAWPPNTPTSRVTLRRGAETIGVTCQQRGNMCLAVVDAAQVQPGEWRLDQENAGAFTPRALLRYDPVLAPAFGVVPCGAVRVPLEVQDRATHRLLAAATYSERREGTPCKRSS
ncbi:MAG: VWA domain-containing protein, partial [Chloroflexi bacterium]|nr:VWA domain-containing protein [Chloroflexota bacterium]